MRSRRFGLALKPAFGIVVGTALGLGTLVPGQIAPASPTDQQLAERLRPPAWMDGGTTSHLLGTDSLGRGVCSRVIYGARTTFLVALAASLIGGIGGAGPGGLARPPRGGLDGLGREVGALRSPCPALPHGVA